MDDLLQVGLPRKEVFALLDRAGCLESEREREREREKECAGERRHPKITVREYKVHTGSPDNVDRCFPLVPSHLVHMLGSGLARQGGQR